MASERDERQQGASLNQALDPKRDRKHKQQQKQTSQEPMSFVEATFSAMRNAPSATVEAGGPAIDRISQGLRDAQPGETLRDAARVALVPGEAIGRIAGGVQTLASAYQRERERDVQLRKEAEQQAQEQAEEDFRQMPAHIQRQIRNVEETRSAQQNVLGKAPEEELGAGTDFMAGVKRVQQILPAADAFIRALAGDQAGVDRAMERLGELQAEAAALTPDEASITRIDNFSDATRWAQFNILSNFADIGVTMLTGGIASKVGQSAVKRGLRSRIADSVSKTKAVGEARDRAIKALTARAVSRSKAPAAGALVGTGAATGGMYAPEIAMRVLPEQEDGEGLSLPARAMTGMVGTTLAGVTGAVPGAHLLSVPFKRLGLMNSANNAVKESFVRAVGKDALTQTAMEVPAEVLQEIVVRGSHKFVNDNIDLFDDEALVQYLEAGVASAVVAPTTTGALSGTSLGLKRTSEFALGQLDRAAAREKEAQRMKMGQGQETTVHASTPPRQRMEQVIPLAVGQSAARLSPKFRAEVEAMEPERQDEALRVMGTIVDAFHRGESFEGVSDAELRGTIEDILGDDASDILDQLEVEAAALRGAADDIVTADQEFDAAIEDGLSAELDRQLRDEFEAQDADVQADEDVPDQVEFGDTARPEPQTRNLLTDDQVRGRAPADNAQRSSLGNVWLGQDTSRRLFEEGAFRDEPSDPIQRHLDELNQEFIDDPASRFEGERVEDIPENELPFRRRRFGDALADVDEQGERATDRIFQEAERLAEQQAEKNTPLARSLGLERGDEGFFATVEEAREFLNNFEVIEERNIPRQLRDDATITRRQFQRATSSRSTRGQPDAVTLKDAEGNDVAVDLVQLVRDQYARANDVMRRGDPEQEQTVADTAEQARDQRAPDVPLTFDDHMNNLQSAVGSVITALNEQYGVDTSNLDPDTVIFREAGGRPVTIRSLNDPAGAARVRRDDMAEHLSSELQSVYSDLRDVEQEAQARGFRSAEDLTANNAPDLSRKRREAFSRRKRIANQMLSGQSVNFALTQEQAVDLLRRNNVEFQELERTIEQGRQRKAPTKQESKDRVRKQKREAQKEFAGREDEPLSPDTRDLLNRAKEGVEAKERAVSTLEQEGIDLQATYERLRETNLDVTYEDAANRLLDEVIRENSRRELALQNELDNPSRPKREILRELQQARDRYQRITKAFEDIIADNDNWALFHAATQRETLERQRGLDAKEAEELRKRAKRAGDVTDRGTGRRPKFSSTKPSTIEQAYGYIVNQIRETGIVPSTPPDASKGMKSLFTTARKAYAKNNSLVQTMAEMNDIRALMSDTDIDVKQDTAALQEIVKQLGFKDVNVRVVDYTQATTDPELRPHVRPGMDGVVKVSVDNETGRVDADIYVPEGQSATRRWSNLSHELGHAVFRAAGNRISKADAKKLLQAFNQWRTEQGLKEVSVDEMLKSKKPIAEIIEGLYDRAHGRASTQPKRVTDHLNSFEEWFADNFARWATTDERPQGVVEKFFHDVAQALKKIANWALGNTYVHSQEVGDVLGDQVVREYLNGLWDSKQNGVVRNVNLWRVLETPISRLENTIKRLDKDSKLFKYLDSLDIDVTGRELNVKEKAQILFASYVDVAGELTPRSNEAIQEALLKTLTRRELNYLARAFNSAPVRRQIFRHLAAAGDFAGVQHADTNWLARVAYGYQLWQFGGLNLSKFGDDTFNSLYKTLHHDVFGRLTGMEQSEKLFEALSDGLNQMRRTVFTENLEGTSLSKGHYFLSENQLRQLDQWFDKIKASKTVNLGQLSKRQIENRLKGEVNGLSDEDAALLASDISVRGLSQPRIKEYRDQIRREGYVPERYSMLDDELRTGAFYRFARGAENLVKSLATHSPLGRLFLGAASRARMTGNAAIRDFTNVLMPDVTGARQGQGFINAKWSGIRRRERQVEQALRGLNAEEIEALNDAFLERRRIDPKNKKLREAQNKIITAMREVWQYTKDSGVNVGERDTDSGVFWPLIFDVERMGPAELEAFAEYAAQDKFKRGWGPVLFGSDWKAKMKTVDDLTPHIMGYMARVLDNDGLAIDENVDVDERAVDEVLTPRARSVNLRRLDFLINGEHVTQEDRDFFAGFMSRDFGRNIATYLESMIKRAEYARFFGADGSKFKEMVDRAIELGATDEDIRLMQQMLHASLGTLGLELPDAVRNTYNKVAETLGQKPLASDTASRARQSRAFRQTMGWGVVVQNMALLGLSALTNAADAATIALRTEDVPALVRGFREGLEAVKAEMRGEGDLNDLQYFVNEVGTAEQIVLNDQLAQLYGGVHFTGKQRQLSEWFFKWNGMQMLTRYLRTVATATARSYLIKHAVKAQFGEQKSKDALAELGLTEDDVKITGAGKEMKLSFLSYRQRQELLKDDIVEPNMVHEAVDDAALDELRSRAKGGDAKASAELDRQNRIRKLLSDDRVRAATLRLVDESVTRPNATQRPIWGSDPNYSLFFHLKSFMYAYQERVVRRVATQIGEGNAVPIVLLLTLVPAVMGSLDFLREFIQHGHRAPHRAHLGIGGLYWDAIERSGALGIGTYITDMQRSAEFAPGGAFSKGAHSVLNLAGPTVSQAVDVGRAMTGNKDLSRTVIEKLPFNTVYKYYLEDGVEGLESRIERQVQDRTLRERQALEDVEGPTIERIPRL